jgi:hypothetical protein
LERLCPGPTNEIPRAAGWNFFSNVIRRKLLDYKKLKIKKEGENYLGI